MAELGQTCSDTFSEEFVSDIISHCRRHRDKVLSSDDPRDVYRWNSVLLRLENNELRNAREFTAEWAAKGWPPWVELHEKLNSFQEHEVT